MRKFLIAIMLFVSALFTSCNKKDYSNLPHTDYPEYIYTVHTTSKGYEYVEKDLVRKIQFEGHDYIIFEMSTHKAGVVHNPECRKCNNNSIL